MDSIFFQSSRILRFSNRIKYLLSFWCLLIIPSPALEDKLPPTEKYPHFSALDLKINFWLYWKFDDVSITFEVHGRTDGWVALGIGASPDGLMKKADFYVGCVNNGVASVTDMHGAHNGSTSIVPDTRQDATLMDGFEENRWTVVKFRRPLILCDTAQDANITADTLSILWALGNTDFPLNISSWNYLTENTNWRGMKKLLILQGSGNYSRNESTQHIDVINEIILPSNPTHYNCRLFKMPTFPSKRHIIQIDPMVQSDNVHHVIRMVLYRCLFEKPQNKDLVGVNHECRTKTSPKDFQACTDVIHAWAIGGTTFFYPANVGFAIGEGGFSKFVLLETHYNNPENRTDIGDSSGFRLVHTDELRAHDGGVLLVGHVVKYYAFTIPPSAEDFDLFSECPNTCINQAIRHIRRDNIQLFGILFHSHRLATKMTLRHLKKKNKTTDMEYGKLRHLHAFPHIAQDNNYDVTHQESRVLLKEVTFKIGESMQLVCTYNTENERNLTMGSYGMDGEMCVAYVHYYPKIPLTKCQTYPDLKLFYSNAYNIRFRFEDPEVKSVSNVILTDPYYYRIVNFTMQQEIYSKPFYQYRITLIQDVQKDTTRQVECENTTDFPVKPPPWSIPPWVRYFDQPPLTCGLSRGWDLGSNWSTTKLLCITTSLVLQLMQTN